MPYSIEAVSDVPKRLTQLRHTFTALSEAIGSFVSAIRDTSFTSGNPTALI